jgi:hypothetical protein
MNSKCMGRAIAQAVICRLSTAAARIRSPVRSCVTCAEQSSIRAGVLRVLLFTMQIFIQPIALHSLIIRSTHAIQSDLGGKVNILGGHGRQF